MADLRTGPGFRMRCPFDDGTTAHNAIEMHGGMPLDTFAKALQLFARCACGRGMVMLKSGAPEPKDAPAEYAAERAADVPTKLRRRKVKPAARSDRADVRLTPEASALVASEGLLRDDVAAVLGRASMDGEVRRAMSTGTGSVVFMLSARMRGDVFVWSAAREGAPRG